MTTCILCLGQLRKGKSVKLSEPVCDTFTLGDAIRQQIQSNILLPFTQSSSQLTCRTCLSSFQSFFKFLRKVNSNLNNFKTEKTFEITPDCQQVYVPPNILLLKMEPQVLLPRIKVEPELMTNYENLVKVDVFDDNFTDNFNQSVEGSIDKSTTKATKSKEQDRFSDDSDFAWSYDDPMDSQDDNEADGMDNNDLSAQNVKDWTQLQNGKAENYQSSYKRDNSLDRANLSDIKEETPKKSKKSKTKRSKNSDRVSKSSEIKIESSDDEFNNSEVKYEDSDDELDNSDTDHPVFNKKSTKSAKKSSKSPRSHKSARTRSLRSNKDDSNLNLTTDPAQNIENSIKSKHPEPNPSEDTRADIKPSNTDPNGPIPLFPARSKTGYMRYLPRDQITLEMVNSGQQYVVIDGVEYKIPQKPGKVKPKKKKSSGFTREEDASRRSHPSKDPEGQAKIRNFMDIKCYVCGTEFESFFKLRKHFKRFHPNNQAYLSCCDRKYKRRCDLLDHIEQHEKSAVHMCNICNKNYKTKGCLKTHMRFYHPKDGSEQVICYECGKMFNNSNLLKMHLQTHERDTGKSFECYVCKKKFRNIPNVKRHLALSHAITPIHIICHICSASVKEAYLSSHMKSIHNSDRTRVNCERCGIWVLKSTFKVHMMKHTDMGVNCKVCGKFLKSSYSLTTHMKTVHSDNFKFRCEYCDKGFHRDVKMQEHIAVRHTREFPFKCRVSGCGREFRAEGNWKTHEKKAHPEEYDKYYKPFYKRDNKELEELLGVGGGQL